MSKPEEIGFKAADKFVDVKIGGSDDKKYAVATINRDGKRILCSQGYSEKNVFGRDAAGANSLQLLPMQTMNSDFEKVFLFETISFAVDNNGRLWIMGGQIPRIDDRIFPRALLGASEGFNGLTLTKFHVAAKRALNLPDTAFIRVKDIDYCPEIMLLTLDIKENHDSPSREERVTLSQEGEEPYSIKLLITDNAFIYNGKVWRVQEPTADVNGQQQ